MKSTRIVSYTKSLLVTLAASPLFIAAPAYAQVVDDFSNGYPGVTGNGWSNTWLEYVQNDPQGDPRTTIDVSVETANPLTGAGPRYLFSDAALTTGNNNRSAGIRRQFGAFGDFDPSNPFQLTTYMRMDSVVAAASRLTFDVRKGNAGGATSPDTDSAFAIASGADYGNTWQLTDGSHISDFVDTEVELFQGDTYRIIFDINPQNNTYSALFTNMDHAANSRSGPASYQSGVLDFINTDSGAINWIFYNMRLNNSEGLDVHEFSLGDVSIVPEARHGAFALGLVALGALLMWRRKKAL